MPRKSSHIARTIWAKPSALAPSSKARSAPICTWSQAKIPLGRPHLAATVRRTIGSAFPDLTDRDAQSQVLRFRDHHAEPVGPDDRIEPDDLESLATTLLQAEMPFPKAVRLLGVSLSSLQMQGKGNVEPQLDLPI